MILVNRNRGKTDLSYVMLPLKFLAQGEFREKEIFFLKLELCHKR